jgi:disulfide oxidoreductase YuzD
MTKISWLTEPEEHDYPAAESFLLLLFPAPQVNKIIANLQAAKNVTFKAKDVFRASGLSLLGVSNSHVTKDREKIKSGKALSPILLVRDNGRLIIADGYHRMCAVYAEDEDADIPCRIV